MSYNLFITRNAQKELSNLDKVTFEQIKKHILQLANDPRPSGCKKLVEREGWRIRIGNTRVIYEINDDNSNILILDVGHRKDIYD